MNEENEECHAVCDHCGPLVLNPRIVEIFKARHSFGTVLSTMREGH